MKKISDSESGAAEAPLPPPAPDCGLEPCGFAALWCPDFRLQAVARGASSSERPRLLVDGGARRSAVVCANAAARRCGAGPGMPTVQALARCPGAGVDAASPAAEAAAARLLLEAALDWVPVVEESAAGLVALDLSTQPGGEREAGARRALAELEAAGLEAAAGLGATPSLARFAALAAWRSGERCGRLEAAGRLAALDRLPLELAGAGEALEGRLRSWGVATLGDFARLEREAVAARLGREGLELWTGLSGRPGRPLLPARPERLFEAGEDFECGRSERAPLLFAVCRRLGSLAERAERTGRAVAAVRLALFLEDGACLARRLAPPRATQDGEALRRLVCGHLETLETQAPVAGFRIRLEVVETTGSQRLLFGAGLRNAPRLEETLRGLRRLVGGARVGSPRHPAARRPGAFDLASLPESLGGEGGAAAEGGGGGPPPAGPVLRRWRPGVKARVRLREGRPVLVESARVVGVVAGLRGPWRSGGEWWRPGGGWERVEWDVELRHHGLYRLAESGGEWTVEGFYD